jgi:hypothetical protein
MGTAPTSCAAHYPVCRGSMPKHDSWVDFGANCSNFTQSTPGCPFSNVVMPYLRVSPHLPRALVLLLLLIGGLHPNPGPPASFNQFFNFLQLNINGIQKSSFELSSFFLKPNPGRRIGRPGVGHHQGVNSKFK